MTSSQFHTVDVNTWQEVRTVLGDLPFGWAFRGQADSQWTLQTTLERVTGNMSEKTRELLNTYFNPIMDALDSALGPPAPGSQTIERETFLGSVAPDLMDLFDSVRHAELKAMREFQESAHRFLTAPSLPTSLLEWLALMQHHGAPTRLLDWTESPYVASFFALEASAHSCSVWAMDVGWLRLHAQRRLREALGPEALSIPAYSLFDTICRRGISGVFPVKPDHLNERVSLQHGLFVALGNTRLGFLQNLASFDSELETHLLKVNIPKGVQAEALADLSRMNISRATLFPGLDGLAQSIKYGLQMESDSLLLSAQLAQLAQKPEQTVSLLRAVFSMLASSKELTEAALGLLGKKGLITPEQQVEIASTILGAPEPPKPN